jgi:hypothetical protein
MSKELDPLDDKSGASEVRGLMDTYDWANSSFGEPRAWSILDGHFIVFMAAVTFMMWFGLLSALSALRRIDTAVATFRFSVAACGAAAAGPG